MHDIGEIRNRVIDMNVLPIEQVNSRVIEQGLDAGFQLLIRLWQPIALMENRHHRFRILVGALDFLTYPVRLERVRRQEAHKDITLLDGFLNAYWKSHGTVDALHIQEYRNAVLLFEFVCEMVGPAGTRIPAIAQENEG